MSSDPASAPNVPRISSAATATVARLAQPDINGPRRFRAVRSVTTARSSSVGPGRTPANNSPSPRSSRRAADEGGGAVRAVAGVEFQPLGLRGVQPAGDVRRDLLLAPGVVGHDGLVHPSHRSGRVGQQCHF